MKHTPALLVAGAICVAALFTGCGQPKDAGSGDAQGAAATTSAPAPTTGRAITITANDTMKFNMTEIRAKAGEALAVTLVNEGSIPKFSMGHNWVLVTPDADLNTFAQDAALAAATNYIPDSFKAKVLASTKLLGPKESDTVIFHAPKTPGRYPFICSFPGHMQVGMKGELIVE